MNGTARLTVAIVGAGVSGCYAAQMLSRALPAAEITVIERLPVPYGLLRYGVAADHQGTKGVQQQFERLFAAGKARLVGGLTIGKDISLVQLQQWFDVVILATGLAGDRRLAVPGEALPGVIGSGRLTRALNSHPDEVASTPVLAQEVAVVGAGNVALDIVRLLARHNGEWQGSDMDSRVLAGILPKPVTRVHLVVRGKPHEVRWDAAMLRELAGLARPQLRIAAFAGSDEPSRIWEILGLPGYRTPSEAQAVQSAMPIHLYFDTQIEQVLGEQSVQALRLRLADGRQQEVQVGSVVTAIGFEAQPAAEMASAASLACPGVYRTGWLQTGPNGAIARQRELAAELAGEITNDWTSGRLRTGRPGFAALPDALGYSAWQQIDAAERACAEPGRIRRKCVSVAEMLAQVAR